MTRPLEAVLIVTETTVEGRPSRTVKIGGLGEIVENRMTVVENVIQTTSAGSGIRKDQTIAKARIVARPNVVSMIPKAKSEILKTDQAKIVIQQFHERRILKR